MAKMKKRGTCADCGIHSVTFHRAHGYWRCGVCNAYTPVRKRIGSHQRAMLDAVAKLKARRAAEEAS